MSSLDATGADPLRRLAVILAFALGCAGIFGFLWVNSGGKVPLLGGGYTVAVDLPNVANVVYFSDVMVAGVKVGKVTSVEEQGDHARVVMELDDEVAPLHEGATVTVRAKSLVEESFLEIADGGGAEVASGATLPEGAGQEVTQLDDVLASLDEPTRDDLGRTLVALGAATTESRDAVADAVVGLGDLGREGGTVLDALAAQSEDLAELTGSSTALLAALSSRRAQISTLVGDADLITEATAGQSADLAATVQALPPLLRTVTASSADLQRLATALTPVARNLETAAAPLATALQQLPGTAAELRSTMPALDGVLATAPATLDRVPTLTDDLDGLAPTLGAVLRDVNPTLGYLEPYGPEVAAWFANFAQTVALGDVNGKIFRVMPPTTEQAFNGYPLSTNLGPLDKFNPLPDAGSLQAPGTYGDRTYPRVEREEAPE